MGGGVGPVVEQRGVSVLQSGGLSVIRHWGVPVVHRGLAVVGEGGLADVGLDVLPRLHLRSVAEMQADSLCFLIKHAAFTVKTSASSSQNVTQKKGLKQG